MAKMFSLSRQRLLSAVRTHLRLDLWLDNMASVFLDDLDDFIAPGQACINPLFVLPDAKPVAAKATAAAEEVKPGNAPMQLMLEDDEGPGPLDAVQVKCSYCCSAAPVSIPKAVPEAKDGSVFRLQSRCPEKVVRAVGDGD